MCDKLNNTTPSLILTVQTNFLTIGPNDDLLNSIEIVAENGVLALQPGIYYTPESFSIYDRNITIQGSLDGQTIVQSQIEIYNSTDLMRIENITFQPHWNNNFSYILSFRNSVPILSNLTFNLTQHPRITAIQAIYEEIIDSDLQVLNSTFNGGRGIFFLGSMMDRTGLSVSNSVFNRNYFNPLFILNTKGNAIEFYGSHLMIENSLFFQNAQDYQSETSPRQIYTVYAELTNYFNSLESEINIINNSFDTKIENVLFYANDIGIEVYDLFNVNISRNIFHTTNSWNHIQPNTRIIINNVSNLMNLNNLVRLINNTDIYTGSAAINNNGNYSFISHNVNLLAKNNLFTGRISSTTTSAVNHIHHSWFIYNNNPYPTNVNTIVESIYFGDPQIDNSLRPLWTADVKSGLINKGDRFTNGDLFWYFDPLSRDPDRTRLDIGAVFYPHGIIHHRLNFNRIIQIEDDSNTAILPRSSDYYDWLAFPFLDKMYDPTNLPYARASYVFGENNDNNLFDIEDDGTQHLIEILWNYNDDVGAINFNTMTGQWINDDHVVDSRYGYKFQLRSNSNRNRLLTSGFRYGMNGNPSQSIIIEPSSNGSSREIWLGYFNQPEDPLKALQDIVPYLTEIKTQFWTYSRCDVGTDWLKPLRQVRLQFGEAVSIKYTHNQPKTLVWRTSYDTIPIYEDASDIPFSRQIPPQPQYFVDYAEQSDY
ncbi:MAG: hypothetical protein FWG98_15525, partial [Candidatus Cloacimonetes bacterium]|nr:hypothetical protein [Candidatus Cloacimonadota bacterium]